MLEGVLAALLALPREQGTVEFKTELNLPEDIGRYVSALANTAAMNGDSRAWLVWGVEDARHRLTGTRFDPFKAKVRADSNQSLIMWLQHMTQPPADFAFHEVEHLGQRVVMLEIHPARSAPVAFQRVRYIRIDSHSVRLSEHPDKEARLWAQLGLKEDWSGELVTAATLDDLDPVAIETARSRYIDFLLRSEPDAGRHEAIRMEAGSWPVTTLLNKARITKQGKLTRSALLLLGKDEAAHHLAAVDAKITWVLRDAGNNTLTSQPFGMPFLLATERAFARVRNITLDHLPDGSLFPTPMQRYDQWVVREALHNCVAHQDYRLGGKINLIEHPDRLVLSNLGQFMPTSVEWMLEHQSPPELYRNPWLVDGMIRLRMIEQAGGGIRRMFTTQRQRLFPLPDYSLEPTPAGQPHVELTLIGQVLDVNFARTLMARSDLSLSQVLLLDRVQKGRPLSPAEARDLKSQQLIEGRSPRHFISARVADVAGQKARYIHNRGLDDEHYRRLIQGYLDQYGTASRRDLDNLILSKLPDVLDAEQKQNKLRNLLQGMRRAGLIQREGTRAAPIWRPTSSIASDPPASNR